MLAQEDFYLILPSNTRSAHFIDNRPHHYKIDLPQEIVLQGDWEVGLTEVVFPKTWRHTQKIPLSEEDRIWQLVDQDKNPLFVVKQLPHEPYPGYYEVFEYVIDTMTNDLAEVQITTNYDPVSRRIRWTFPANRTIRLHLSLARLLGFMALTHAELPELERKYTVIPPFLNKPDNFKILPGDIWFEISSDVDEGMDVNLRPFVEATESDMDFCVNNIKTQNIWLSVLLIWLITILIGFVSF